MGSGSDDNINLESSYSIQKCNGTGLDFWFEAIGSLTTVSIYTSVLSENLDNHSRSCFTLIHVLLMQIIDDKSISSLIVIIYLFKIP